MPRPADAAAFDLPAGKHGVLPAQYLRRAIAANVIAAIASALTGRRPKVPAVPPGEALGYELAAAAGEGGFEPSELVLPAGGEVVPASGDESAEAPDSPDR